jgi:hypothetical protein
MKRHAKRLGPQMNLALFNTSSATIIPEGKQEELTHALMELLISAAERNGEQEFKGEKDESETHA